MFQIGEFSRIAQVSASQLRNYDQLGLFSPEKVDPQTGYRYYSAKQLPQLNRVIALKEMGLSLAQIKNLLENGISSQELRGMLLMKKAQIEQSLQEEVARLRYIESRIEQINTLGEAEDYDIVLKSIDAKLLLSARCVLPQPKAARGLARKMQTVLPARVNKRDLGYFTVIMHDEHFSDRDVDIELGFEWHGEADEALRIPLAADTALQLRQLPAEAHVLTVTRVGHPRLAHRSYSALGTWTQAKGYQFSGPVREVFLNPPNPERINETVCEIQVPLQPAAT